MITERAIYPERQSLRLEPSMYFCRGNDIHTNDNVTLQEENLLMTRKRSAASIWAVDVSSTWETWVHRSAGARSFWPSTPVLSLLTWSPSPDPIGCTAKTLTFPWVMLSSKYQLILSITCFSYNLVFTSRIAAACWTLHYSKRIFETIFVHRFSHSTMPIKNLFINCSYYWGFAFYIGYFVNHPLYTEPFFGKVQVYLGLISFLVSFLLLF